MVRVRSLRPRLHASVQPANRIADPAFLSFPPELNVKNGQSLFHKGGVLWLPSLDFSLHRLTYRVVSMIFGRIKTIVRHGYSLHR